MAKKSKAERRAARAAKRVRKGNSAERMAQLRAMRGKGSAQKSDKPSSSTIIIAASAPTARRVDKGGRRKTAKGAKMAGLQRLKGYGSRAANASGKNGINIKESLMQGLFASAGGATSAVVDGVTVYTKNKTDDSPILRFAVKGLASLGTQAFIGKSAKVRDYFSGMIGHSAGAALEEFVTTGAKAARALRTAAEEAEKLAGKDKDKDE